MRMFYLAALFLNFFSICQLSQYQAFAQDDAGGGEPEENSKYVRCVPENYQLAYQISCNAVSKAGKFISTLSVGGYHAGALNTYVKNCEDLEFNLACNNKLLHGKAIVQMTRECGLSYPGEIKNEGGAKVCGSEYLCSGLVVCTNIIDTDKVYHIPFNFNPNIKISENTKITPLLINNIRKACTLEGKTGQAEIAENVCPPSSSGELLNASINEFVNFDHGLTENVAK